MKSIGERVEEVRELLKPYVTDDEGLDELTIQCMNDICTGKYSPAAVVYFNMAGLRPYYRYIYEYPDDPITGWRYPN